MSVLSISLSSRITTTPSIASRLPVTFLPLVPGPFPPTLQGKTIQEWRGVSKIVVITALRFPFIAVGAGPAYIGLHPRCLSRFTTHQCDTIPSGVMRVASQDIGRVLAIFNPIVVKHINFESRVNVERGKTRGLNGSLIAHPQHKPLIPIFRPQLRHPK